MKSIGKVAIILLLLIAEGGVIFISQLYSPFFLWILSYTLLVMSVLVGIFMPERRYRLITTLAFSLAINGNYLAHVPFGNPVITMLLYGLGLTMLSWILLFLIAEVTASIVQQRGRV